MSILKEFKEFAVKGNAVDMAVGIVVGAAFSRIVNSLVNDVIMPPAGLLVSGSNFSSLKFVLKKAVGESSEVAIRYGEFINALVNFLILAFSIFIFVKLINVLRRDKPPAESEPRNPPA
ncbi:MAG: large-conductance mechanosensitive channel protein MscL [Candidatus Omnitrophota bacterium]